MRIRNYLDNEKARQICTAYILSQFHYCNLIWMFCSKFSNQRVQRAHKRALRITYQDSFSSYQELLGHDGSVDIHQRNLFSLMCEVFKSLNHLNPSFIWEFFKPKQIPYSLRKGPLLELPPSQGRLHGIYSLDFRSKLSWNNLPIEIKTAHSLADFKQLLKQFMKNSKIPCNCRLCRD